MTSAMTPGAAKPAQGPVRLSTLVGGGYGAFWSYRGRYRVVKGSRASKKSKTTALWYMSQLSKECYRQANLLVVRKTYRTLHDSCFAELKWARDRLGLQAVWDVKESPLELRNRETGQCIYFRGLDDPQKVTSITVSSGVLCWLWVEEAYEITSEADFDMIDESIRGDMPPGLFKQVTLTFNPWSDRHWIKHRFYDAPPDPGILAMTTNYTCNEWLDDADRKLFATMQRDNPRRYRVAGLGEWGVVDGLVYDRWREERYTLDDVRAYQLVAGLDYGYTNDPTALFVGFLDRAGRRLYVWDEMYQTGMSNRRIYDEIVRMGYGKETITADSAEPKSNDELRGYGLRIQPARKGGDSVNAGIQWIQDLEIIVHPRCVRYLTEISCYAWDKDRFGKVINRPVDADNHEMDAMRYALEPYIIAHRGGKVWIDR